MKLIVIPLSLLCSSLKQVATGQVASTGIVALSYVQKVSEKVSIYIATKAKSKKIGLSSYLVE